MEFLLKTTNSIALLVILCTIITRTVAYPTGAPIAACTTMTPGHYGSSPQTTLTPFFVEPLGDSYRPNDKIIVILSAPCDASDRFGGFMLEARRADARQNTDVPIGAFNTPLKSQSLAGCGTSGQAMTHLNGTEMKNQMVFQWTAPAQASGHVVFAATFAISKTTYWVKVFSKVVKDVSDSSTLDPGSNVYPTRTYCDAPPTLPGATGITPGVTPPPALPLNSACDNTKACMKQCQGLSCEHYVMWYNSTDSPGVVFDVAALVDRDARTWMAIGFSDDRHMGEDLVVECLSFGGQFRVYTSENTITPRLDNVRTTTPVEEGVTLLNASIADGVFRCSFLLSDDPMAYVNMTGMWHLLFAAGNTASFQDNKLQHRIDPGRFPQVSANKIMFSEVFGPSPTAGVSGKTTGFMQMVLSFVFVLTTIFNSVSV